MDLKLFMQFTNTVACNVMRKKCTICGLDKNIEANFPTTKGRNGKSYFRNKCKTCTSKYHCEKYYTTRKKLYACMVKKCSECGEEKPATVEFFSTRKGARGYYFIGRCKKCVNEYLARYKNIRNTSAAKRRKIDPNFKLRQYVSNAINRMLKLQSSSKGGKSILQFLTYSIDELKIHLENQFDDQMSWDNYGICWHVDHIKCQSDYPYQNMSDPNFQIMWSLDNLRPLEAKRNISDGVKRIRHKK
jgi:hypothetical protein